MNALIRRLTTVAIATALISFASAAPAAPASAPAEARAANGSHAAASVAAVETIAPWRPRFGRTRPVVAVVGENAGTELSDFVIPYGVLARSGAADLLAVATRPGALTMRPALRLQPDATTADFDVRFPDGADYVIVPAVVKRTDPTLLAWLSAQSAKGATLVSICDGALVVAGTGLLDGRRATAHWATEGHRAEHHPDTVWVKDARYVVDGRFVSSAGISAAMPVSIALVEAIAGHERATALADELGVGDWSTAHDSDAFKPRLGRNLMAYARTAYTNGRFHRMQSVGVPVAAGVDEIALAFSADAWSRTGRSQAYALAAAPAPVRTRSGLTVLPERVAAAGVPVDRTLPEFAAAPSARSLDSALDAIAAAFGRSTAYGVALAFEYPEFEK